MMVLMWIHNHAGRHRGLKEAGQIAQALAALSQVAFQALPDPTQPDLLAADGAREQQHTMRLLMAKVEVVCRTAEVKLAVLPGFHILSTLAG